MSSTALPSEEILPPSKRAVTCRLKCAEIEFSPALACVTLWAHGLGSSLWL